MLAGKVERRLVLVCAIGGLTTASCGARDAALLVSTFPTIPTKGRAGDRSSSLPVSQEQPVKD